MDLQTLNDIWRAAQPDIVKSLGNMKLQLITSWPDPGRDLIRHIEEALVKAVKRDSWPRNGKLYVSDVRYGIPIEDDGDCPKKLWAILRDEPQNPRGPGVELMFAAGDRLHEAIVEWLQDHLSGGWKVTGVEKKLMVEGLAGRLDIVLENGNLKLKAVVDVKTKRGGAFRYLSVAKSPDVVQVQAYMMEQDASFGILVYIDREGQNWIKCFLVVRDDVEVTRVANVVKDIKQKALAGDSVPGIDPILVVKENKGPNSLSVKWPWQVEWCPLKTCYCQARAEKALPKGVVAHVNDKGVVKMIEKHEANDSLKTWIENQLQELPRE